ncbi:Hypothetical_protein [Hexamita inflata]|uniref:Hypothetical_protein n=1 Tax=Hexamita inflata TaxID=28002 RepID=A0AA86P510_9EUKA|nr:Hypothetical protein HINF_LOCUS18189 [Hexamita inflata]
MKCLTACTINMTGNYKTVFGFDKQYILVRDQEVSLSQQNLARVKYLKVQCDFINTSQFGSDTIDALMILDRSNNFQFQAQTIDVHHKLIKPQEFKFWVTDQDDNAFTLNQIYIKTQFFNFECIDTIHLKHQVFIQLKPKVNLVTQLSYFSVQQISGQLSQHKIQIYTINLQNTEIDSQTKLLLITLLKNLMYKQKLQLFHKIIFCITI